MPADIVSIVDEDPDLAVGLDPARLASASRDLRTASLEVPSGRWEPDVHASTAVGGIGLLVLDGVLARRVGTQRRSGAELLGPGDLLRPTSGDGHGDSIFQTSWRVIEPLRLAVLDQRFLMRMAGYPEVAGELIARAIERARHVLVNMAIAHHPRIDSRLLHLLWHLADRWGRVTPRGVSLPLRLTHELLADLVAAQRPSVTLSLSQLERRGEISRDEGMLLLTGSSPSLITETAAA
ncbi:MAG: Crp/Fnr family transcriptional regulator [Solirubrobacterales bacterium]|nr:Crp/Fnr family transcriptional regulator [Solirubrobacterales bacterium]